MNSKKEMKFATRFALVPFNEYERLRVKQTAPIVDNPLKRPELARSKQTRKELNEQAYSPSLSYDEATDLSQKMERYLSDLRKLRGGTRDLSSSSTQSPITTSSLRKPRRENRGGERFWYENAVKRRRVDSDDEDESRSGYHTAQGEDDGEWMRKVFNDRDSDSDEYGGDSEKSESDLTYKVDTPPPPPTPPLPPAIQISRTPSPRVLVNNKDSPKVVEKRKDSLKRKMSQKGLIVKDGVMADGRVRFSGGILDKLLTDAVTDSSNIARSSKPALNKFQKTLAKANIKTERFPSVSSPIAARTRHTKKKAGKDIKGGDKENEMEQKWQGAED